MLVGLVAGALAHVGLYAIRRPEIESRLALQLEWMRDEFKLSQAQYLKIRTLHDSTGPELERLFTLLHDSHREIDQLEQLRRTSDQVDFVAYHQASTQNRKARQDCRALTLGLVYAVAEVMTPEQRERYFALVGQGVALRPGA
jgi:hypothetical protein